MAVGAKDGGAVPHWWAFNSARRKSSSRRPTQTLYVSADGLPNQTDAALFFRRYFERLGLPASGKVTRSSALPINTSRLVVHNKHQIFGERLKLLGFYPPPSKPGDWV